MPSGKLQLAVRRPAVALDCRNYDTKAVNGVKDLFILPEVVPLQHNPMTCWRFKEDRAASFSTSVLTASYCPFKGKLDFPTSGGFETKFRQFQPFYSRFDNFLKIRLLAFC